MHRQARHVGSHRLELATSPYRPWDSKHRVQVSGTSRPTIVALLGVVVFGLVLLITLMFNGTQINASTGNTPIPVPAPAATDTTLILAPYGDPE